jgi:beta-glucosidase
MLALHGDVLQAGQDNVVPTPDGLDNVRRRLTLTQGAHPITVEVKADPSGNPVQVRLAWVTPDQRARDLAAAVAAAKGAKTAVVFAWSRGKPDPLALAGDQDSLIEAVAAANPNTVVVLNTDSPVAMPWLPKVKAVLQMWYTGDEGGWAAADLLTGRVSPAGRLPFTWPKQLRDAVANDPAHPEQSSAGGPDGKTTYAEGILVGYRWFDRQKVEPLFPFGYGLSYSRFDYSGLRVADAADGGVDVRFTLKNVGAQAAAEVPQVYVGPPATAPEGAQFADRSLVAFDRVTLAPNESKELTLHVAPRRLQYWSESQTGWRIPAGPRPLWVGASSRDMRLTGSTAP